MFSELDQVYDLDTVAISYLRTKKEPGNHKLKFDWLDFIKKGQNFEVLWLNHVLEKHSVTPHNFFLEQHTVCHKKAEVFSYNLIPY